MALFTISDLHLSLSSDKPMDIFKGWEGYVEKLKNNWLQNIAEDDTVVIPGDISWEMRINNTFDDFDFINKLPGRKIIMKGNHDLWWDSVSKMNRFFDEKGFKFDILHNNCYVYGDYALAGSRGWFYDDNTADASKVLLREVGRIERSLTEAQKTGKEIILFLHYPPLTTDSKCDEILNVIEKYNVKRCFYGHIHKAGSFKVFNGTYNNIVFCCVSCDILGFVPLKITN